MLHKVKIDYMPDGYSVATGGSCLDLPAAVVAANYSRECYKYYLALRFSFSCGFAVHSVNIKRSYLVRLPGNSLIFCGRPLIKVSVDISRLEDDRLGYLKQVGQLP